MGLSKRIEQIFSLDLKVVFDKTRPKFTKITNFMTAKITIFYNGVKQTN